MNRNLKTQTERAGVWGAGELSQNSQQDCPKAAMNPLRVEGLFRVGKEAGSGSARVAVAGSRVGGDWVVEGGLGTS